MEKNKVDANCEEIKDEMKWVLDSSFDHKGRVPLRASTGSWKSSLFIIGKELLLTPLDSQTIIIHNSTQNVFFFTFYLLINWFTNYLYEFFMNIFLFFIN